MLKFEKSKQLEEEQSRALEDFTITIKFAPRVNYEALSFLLDVYES